MKKVLLSLFIILALCSGVCAEQIAGGQVKSGAYVTPAQLAEATSSVQMLPSKVAIAGENISAGDIVKIINNGGTKSYKYMSSIMQMGTPSYLISGGMAAPNMHSAKISDTSFMIIYRNGTGNLGKANIVSVVNGVISIGTPVDLISGGSTCTEGSIAIMTNTTALLSFRDGTSRGKCAIATFSGNQISSISSPTEIVTGTDVAYTSTTKMTDTTALVAFTNTSNFDRPTVVLVTISGSTISSISSPTEIEVTNATYNSIKRISDTKALFSYSSSSSGGRALTVTISGSTISSVSAITTYNSGSSILYNCSEVLSSTLAIISGNGSSNTVGYVYAVNISGGAITSISSSAHLVNGGSSNTQIDISRVSDTSAVVGFCDASDGNKSKIVTVTSSGSSPSVSSPISVFSTSAASNYGARNPVVALSSTNFVMVDTDISDSYRAKIVNYAPVSSPISFVAISDSTVTSGASSTFSIISNGSKYINSAFSLTSLSQYYMNSSSQLSTIETQYAVGTAIDATSIFINSSGLLTTTETTIHNTSNNVHGIADTAQLPTITQMNTAIANATASISLNQIVNITAGENLTAGDIVSIINNYGTVTAKKNNLAINSTPNGNASVFSANNATNFTTSCALDETRFAVAYSFSTTIYTIIGTVSGSSISWGSPVSVYSIAGTALSIAKIDTNKYVICVGSGTPNDDRGLIWAYSVSGNVPSALTGGQVFSDGYSPTYISVCSPSTNNIVFAYRGASGYGKCAAWSLSDTTWTKGSETDFNTGYTQYIAVSPMSSTRVAVVYEKIGGEWEYGTVKILSISGTTITPNTQYIYCTGDTSVLNGVTTLSSTKLFVTYEKSVGNTLWAQVLDVADTIITPNIAKECRIGGALQGYDIHATAINSTQALIMYETVTNSTCYTVLATANSDSTISLATPSQFHINGASYMNSCLLSSSKVALVYKNDNSSNYGTAVINTVFNPDYSSIRGLCQTTTSSGNSAPILISGSFDGLTSLITGADYYVQADYSLATTPVSLGGSYIKMGIAKSSTEIILD